MSYTKYAIPVTTTGFLLFLVDGMIVLGQLVVMTTSFVFALALGNRGPRNGVYAPEAAIIALQTRKE